MTFEPYLHLSLQGEYVLVPFIKLNSIGGLLLACLGTIIICLMERLLSTILESQWEPSFLKLGRRKIALWRTLVYSLATFLRLCYMLIAMTLHLGLILTIVTTLATAQFFIELSNLPKPPSLAGMDEAGEYRPLYSNAIKTRPRSRSKPDGIFIHPTQSNIARADAAAMEMGLTHSTERVQDHRYDQSEPAWETGKGKDMAREMLLPKKETISKPPQRQRSKDQFYIGNDESGSESD